MNKIISGVEVGYGARNTKLHADIINYHVKIFDTDREGNPGSLYVSLMSELDRTIRKEIGIPPSGSILRVSGETNESEDSNSDGSSDIGDDDGTVGDDEMETPRDDLPSDSEQE